MGLRPWARQPPPVTPALSVPSTQMDNRNTAGPSCPSDSFIQERWPRLPETMSSKQARGDTCVPLTDMKWAEREAK